jgi:hypothetical protein
MKMYFCSQQNILFGCPLGCLFYITLCCLGTPSERIKAQDSTSLSPKEILTRIKARAAEIRTAYLVASWEEFGPKRPSNN